MHPRTDSFDTLRALPRAGKGPSTPLVPAVSRALALLERLAGAREPMSLARLAGDLALPKSSVHGLCNTLVSLRLPAPPARRRLPDRARGVMGLAEAFVSGTDVAQEFNALWADGGHAPEETVVLSVLSGTDALYVGVQQERAAARPGVQRRHAPAGLSLRQRQGDARLAAGRRGAPPLRRRPRHAPHPARDRATSRRCSRSWRWRGGAATASTTKACAKASIRSARRCSTPPAKPSPRSSVCINKAQLGSDRGSRHRELALAVAADLSRRIGGDARPARRLEEAAA